METIAVVKYKTIDNKMFDNEKDAFEHEGTLLEMYSEKLCSTLNEEQAKILQMIVDRNTNAKDSFNSKLNSYVSRKVFGILDK